MIKTDLQILEENRDQARSMALALEAQISLTEMKVFTLVRPDQEADRIRREKELSMLKLQKVGHDQMVEKFDRMIEEEQKKHETVRGSDR